MFGKSSRGPLSAFGLALVSVLALCAISAGAAQASPVWHIEGKTFAELGISEKKFSMGGQKLRLDAWEWEIHFVCSNTSGSGKLTGPAGGEATLLANNCVMLNQEKSCKVHPIQMNVDIGLVEGENGTIVETFSPDKITLIVEGTNELCPWWAEEVDLFVEEGESFGAAFPYDFEAEFPYSEAKKQVLTGSSNLALQAYAGGQPVDVYLEGTFGTELLSKQKFGAW